MAWGIVVQVMLKILAYFMPAGMVIVAVIIGAVKMLPTGRYKNGF